MEPTYEYRMALACRRDTWIPACGGHEKPLHYRNGVVALYVFNPRTGQHAYLNVSTDMIMTEEEVKRMLP